jgi:predicted enzyme related to lactoylglutathione lyase
MRRVTGIGGVFFKAKDAESLYQWYEKHLGIKREHGTVVFRWSEDGDPEGCTAWAIFKQESKYFGTSPSSFMLNFRVDDMDGLLQALQAEGVWIDPKRDDSEYGKFAWIMDPESNRIELWEPPKGKSAG